MLLGNGIEKSGQILAAASQWFEGALLKEVTYLTQKFIDVSFCKGLRKSYAAQRSHECIDERNDRPAGLEVLFALSQRIGSRHFGCASKSPRVSTLKCALGCLLDFVQLSVKILCHFLKHGLIAKGTVQHVAVQHWAAPPLEAGGLHNAKWRLRFCSSHCPQSDCDTLRPTFEYVAPTSHETPAQDSSRPRQIVGGTP